MLINYYIYYYINHFLVILEPTVIFEALYSVHKHNLLLKENS